MNAKINKSIFIIFLLVFISGCRIFTSFEEVYLENSNEFNEFAEKFLVQGEIKHVAINYGFLPGWEVVNNCARHSDNGPDAKWECTEEGIYPEEIDFYLDDIEDVLGYQKINRNYYDKVVSFLKEHDLDGMGKDSDNKIVDFESRLSGLRYFQDANNEFNEDREYIYVKKLNDHWYVYERDWN